jgi:hypothetical protein
MPVTVQVDDESVEQKNEQVVKLATRIEEAGRKLVKIVVERRFGRQGYTRGGLGFITVVPPVDDEKPDDPLETAELVVGIAEDEAAKHPEARHFRITLLAMDGSGEPCIVIGKPLIYEAQSAAPPDDKGELMAMQRSYISDLQAANVRLANANAGQAEKVERVIASTATVVTAIGTSSSNLRGEHMVKLAELMMKEKSMDLEHALATHKTDKGFAILESIVGDVGPALAAWLSDKLGIDPSKTTGPLAKRLDAILSSIPKDKIEDAKLVIGDEAWTVLQAARKAKDDQVFKAQFEKLKELWSDKMADLKEKLPPIIGPENLVALAHLLKAAGVAE